MAEMVYSVAETAALLKTNRAYIYKIINAGQLKVIKLPTTKIRRSELERFLEQYEGYDLTDPKNPVRINFEEIAEESE